AQGDRKGIRPESGKPVFGFRRAGGGGIHRPGASRHHHRGRRSSGESAAAGDRGGVRPRSESAGTVRPLGGECFGGGAAAAAGGAGRDFGGLGGAGTGSSEGSG